MYAVVLTALFILRRFFFTALLFVIAWHENWMLISCVFDNNDTIRKRTDIHWLQLLSFFVSSFFNGFENQLGDMCIWCSTITCISFNKRRADCVRLFFPYHLSCFVLSTRLSCIHTCMYPETVKLNLFGFTKWLKMQLKANFKI